ncbi:DUF3899 domain-containing protein [Nicoliella spurrieriana]|uniref:DUF3899 domain-containing protein n=1 Tax=Nicoliella spurrieriana TaxID=2925830 RepID=A0A976RT12_9LACO|nr:DUF3899 domain-containing protein [Nicoliella spurrieriana]UQS87066.1 DUF3899 domain-containing protein [Nicoliella spurrieriana]
MTIALTILIAVGPLIIGANRLTVMISNIYFMVGLLMLMVAAFIMILGGHLFTGWRRMRRRGDDADLPDERVPARKVGRLKNAPIRLNRPANFCLQVALPLMVMAIIITMI